MYQENQKTRRDSETPLPQRPWFCHRPLSYEEDLWPGLHPGSRAAVEALVDQSACPELGPGRGEVSITVTLNSVRALGRRYALSQPGRVTAVVLEEGTVYEPIWWHSGQTEAQRGEGTRPRSCRECMAKP